MKTANKLRIVDGNCRITTGYCPGKGDDGTSQGLKSKRIAKHNPAIKFYSPVEDLQIAISHVLLNTKLMQSDVINFLQWLEEASFSLSSYCHCGGESERHALPSEMIAYVHEQTAIWWPLYAASKDFCKFSSHENLAALNQVRVAVRKVEIAFVEWKSSPEIQYQVERSPKLEQSINAHASCLNRLSSYFWCAIQREGKKLGLVPSCWQGEMPKFNQKTLLD